MPTYTLDFSLSTELDRCAAITKICACTTYTQDQYTQMADYILLANKQNNTYPEYFKSPSVQHTAESLDSLLDDPLTVDFVENCATPVQKSIYKKNRRKIDRDNTLYQNIPGMTELWTLIDYYKEKMNSESSSLAWRTKRLLISLYQQQYSLLETYFPENIYINNTIYHAHSLPQKQFYQWYAGILVESGIAHIDLCNPQHMAKFLLLYPALKDYCTSDNCDLYEMLADTEQAYLKAKLTPLQCDVLTLYHRGKSGIEISFYLKQHYNRTLTQYYISIIFNKQIAAKIAEEYAEIYHSRIWANDPTKWRVCLGCKQKKLLTKHNFHHFSNKPGGFALYCKECTAAKKKGIQK